VWLDATDLLRSVDMPLLVLSATEDDVCPMPMVKDLFDAASSPHKKLVWVEGMSHDSVALNPVYWTELGEFVRRVTHSKVRPG